MSQRQQPQIHRGAAETAADAPQTAASMQADAAAASVITPPVSASAVTAAAAASSVSAGSKRKSRSDSSTSHHNEEKQAAEKQAADSSAIVSEPNPHLASVLENSAAAAPDAKRTRRVQESAQTAAVHARASPMMRLLGSDSGARQSLFEMMDADEIALLQCTGRSWRGWIAEAPFIGAREITIIGDLQHGPSRCVWLRRSMTHLKWADSRTDAALDRVLSLRWSRLRGISARFGLTRPSVESLREGFSFVAATLQQLEVTLWCVEMFTATNILAAVDSLQQLESLSVEGCDFSSLDLSPLLSLPRLQRFALQDDQIRPCSLAQVDALSQCKSLTDLRCGQWLPICPADRGVGPAVQLTAAQLQQIEDGLGRLVRLRKENDATPLRRLYLGNDPMILPQCWRVLSQFTSLEKLEAHWSCTLTADDWMLLATFPRLHTLRVRELEWTIPLSGGFRAPLELCLVLSSLIRCRALRTLGLDGAFDLRTEHVAMLAQIPSLQTFEGLALRVESLDSLANAPALTTLSLEYCIGLRREPINIRSMIPAMPLVSQLTIRDHTGSQMTPEQAEPFNVAVRARLPKLVRFTQSNFN